MEWMERGEKGEGRIEEEKGDEEMDGVGRKERIRGREGGREGGRKCNRSEGYMVQINSYLLLSVLHSFVCCG